MSKNYSVTFDVNANISDLRTSLKSINNLLSNASIKIPQNISTNLSKLINTLNLEMDKLESLDGKKLDAKGAKQVNRSYDKIASTFQQIKLTMNDLSKKSGIKVEDFFPSSIEEQIKGATAALKEYKEAIAKGPKKGSEYDKTSQEIKNKKTELQRLKQRQRNEEIKKQQAESQKQALDEQFGIKKQEEDQAKRDKEKAKQDKERARSQKRTLEQQGRLRKKIAALESKEKEETTKAEAKQTEMATKKNKQTAK